MAASRLLERLLKVREMEEEQSWLALESALQQLRLLEHAQAAAKERERAGRRLVEESARSGELTDRIAGLEETRAGGRRATALVPKIAAAGSATAALRREYLQRRTSRRQAETLVEQARARDETTASRRGQRALDDWYLSRRRASGERK